MTDPSAPPRALPSATLEELRKARGEHRRALADWRRNRDEMRWAPAEVARDRVQALADFADRQARILAAIRPGKTLAQLTAEFRASRRYLVRLRTLLKSRGEAVPRDPTRPRPTRARPDETTPPPSRARERSRGNIDRPCALS